MSPLGLVLIGIGLLMIVIGFKGSQHSVMAAFKNVHGGSKSRGNSGGKDSKKNPPDMVDPNPKLM